MAAAGNTEADVKLLAHWPSPYVQRVAVALHAKGIKYEAIPQDMQNKSELLLKSNPIYKKIPVLLHNGNPVVESVLIVQYIDECWPGNDEEGIPSFLPKDPLGKAKARFWADFIDKKILETAFRSVRSKDFAGFTENLSILEEELAKHEDDFFGGKTLSLPDITLAPMAVWFPAFAEVAGLPLPGPEKLPCLHKLLDAIKAHPAGVSALPEVPKQIEYVRMISKYIF